MAGQQHLAFHGDEQHLVKHAASISLTPVVFGIRQSLAEEPGLYAGRVSVRDILAAIRDGKMSFCMTSRTSPTPEPALISAFFTPFGQAGGNDGCRSDNEELTAQVQELLGGVERSSGSSDWLKELFLERDYDAMVNYECLIIDADRQLEAEGREPLYVVYPYDGPLPGRFASGVCGSSG